MTKLPLHTPNKTDKNIQAIVALFPNTLTERITGYNEDGSAIIEHAINFDMLRQELSSVLVEGAEERYTFNWPDKRQSVLLANMPNFKTLRPCRDESVNFDATENLYIEGDNIEVLKLLQETYLGKVKMIYIDPPYNTGKDSFVYDDDFSENIADYNEDSGDFDEDGCRLYQNLSTNGRFHTDWLNMIYPRLKVAKDLLRDDGVIFISIDDNEVHNLRKICDEVFGAWNYLTTLTRRTKSGGGSAAHHFAVEHDYLVVYSKNKISLPPLSIPFEESYAKRYAECDEYGRFFWDTMERSSTATIPYIITAPDGQQLTGKWFRSKERFLKDLDTGEVRFLKKDDGSWSVQFKQRMAEGRKIRTILGENEFKSSQCDFEAIRMVNYFDFPKTVYLLMHFMRAIKGNNDIILDFFSGSATTAHAVMQLNAEDDGNRKFIMVQIPEAIDEKHEAYRAGHRTICDIGKERIRRAGKKINDAIDEGNRQIKLGEEPKKPVDIGFRVLKVDSTNMKDVYYEPEEIMQTMLDGSIDNIKDDRTPEDLLFQVMLDLGVLLSSKIESEVVGGKNVFTVYNGGECYLIACFDAGVTAEVVTAIAKRQPYYAVFRDSGMASDSLMTSFEQIFEAYSKSTVRRVL